MREARPQSERSEAPKVRRRLDGYVSPFSVRLAVLSVLLGLEPGLAQQLRYPLRCDGHFKDTDATRCQRIGDRVEYRRRRADRAALADTLGTGDARLGQCFQMMDFDARDFGCRRHGIVGK